MDWIEIIHLRSHTQQDRAEAVAAFQNLSMPDRDSLLGDVSLFQDQTLGNDLSIIIHWYNRHTKNGKSPLGLQLAAAFSEFGMINHSVWLHEASLLTYQRRSINAF
jgi:hypothetical protein